MLEPRPRVALFVTCLVDMMRPSVAFAAVKLLEEAGCDVEAPAAQTCCGQPAYNSGARGHAIAIARRVIGIFAGYDYVVAPSGSCAGMIVKHYPQLFAAGTADHAAAVDLARRSHELVSFLVKVMKVERVTAQFAARATYHDSCSGLRELGIMEEPRKLLATVDGVSLREMKDADVCCGFGGTFCVKYPDISDKMLERKIAHVGDTGADTLIAGDLGCLMNMAGMLKRQGSAIKVRHVAEVLAGDMATPTIAEA